MKELFELLGARYGWCWVEYLEYSRRIEPEHGMVIVETEINAIREYSWDFLYWPAPKQRRFINPVISNKPQTILSGFKSRNRGRHWNRRNHR